MAEGGEPNDGQIGDISEVKESQHRLERSLAVLQASVDNVARCLQEPSVAFPITTFGDLEAVEDKLKNQAERRQIRVQLRGLIRQNDEDWLSKLYSGNLLMEYNVNDIKGSMSLCDLELIHLVCTLVDRNKKSDISAQLRRIKDRYRKTLKRRARNQNQQENRDPADDDDPPPQMQVVQ
ncbi:hypothetical protein DMENIID0001_061040 [Sergentomyia squamirostris]